MDGVEASTEDMIANPSLVEGYSPSGELSGELLMEGERIIWQLRVEETAA